MDMKYVTSLIKYISDLLLIIILEALLYKSDHYHL